VEDLGVLRRALFASVYLRHTYICPWGM